MTLETLLVLLFTVFAVPGACFLTLLGAYIRIVWLRWQQQRDFDRRLFAQRQRGLRLS
jgi:hypothetical protein